MAIAMEIYEKIRYYREHTDNSQRNVAKILGVSRNTVKKYWEGEAVPWERKPGSGRKNDIITDEVKSFIIKCIPDFQQVSVGDAFPDHIRTFRACRRDNQHKP